MGTLSALAINMIARTRTCLIFWLITFGPFYLPGLRIGRGFQMASVPMGEVVLGPLPQRPD